MNNQSGPTNKKKSKLMLFILWGTIIFLLGYIAVLQMRHVFCHAQYEYITGECTDLVIDKKGYVELKDSLLKYLDAEKSAGRLYTSSVYFRDLNRGPVMGINETDLYSSASLLKLPIVLGILRIAESDATILDTILINEQDDPDKIDQFFVPEKEAQNNVSYTVRELIFYALAYSDNTAIQMLKEFIEIKGGEENRLELTLNELGLILPDELMDQDVSTRGYASLFRLLYNASYLNPEYSEMVLKIMTQSNFNLGIRSGVPEGIEISHKFGERFLEDSKQLHDCGIVYFPENPYLLCVMTMGKDFQELENVISTVSKMVYEEVDSRRLDK